jgi:hypothetical protein
MFIAIKIDILINNYCLQVLRLYFISKILLKNHYLCNFLNISYDETNIETKVETPSQQSKQMRHKEIHYLISIHQRTVLFTKFPEEFLDQSQT